MSLFVAFVVQKRLAADTGNGNDFTPTNLVATDQMKDSPTNNFATLNPLDAVDGTFSEGNLKLISELSSHSSSARVRRSCYQFGGSTS